MKAVFDTNVLISVFLSDGVPREVFRRVLAEEVVFLTSKGPPTRVWRSNLKKEVWVF